MDFSGPVAHVNPTTSASPPAATSVIALAILTGRGNPALVVVKVLNAGTPGLQLAIDVHQTIDPNLQAGPAEAGLGVEIDVKQFPGAILDGENSRCRRNHGDHDLAIAGDLCNG